MLVVLLDPARASRTWDALETTLGAERVDNLAGAAAAIGAASEGFAGILVEARLRRDLDALLELVRRHGHRQCVLFVRAPVDATSFIVATGPGAESGSLEFDQHFVDEILDSDASELVIRVATSLTAIVEVATARMDLGDPQMPIGCVRRSVGCDGFVRGHIEADELGSSVVWSCDRCGARGRCTSALGTHGDLSKSSLSAFIGRWSSDAVAAEGPVVSVTVSSVVYNSVLDETSAQRLRRVLARGRVVQGGVLVSGTRSEFAELARHLRGLEGEHVRMGTAQGWRFWGAIKRMIAILDAALTA